MARKFNAGYYFSEGFHSIFTHGFMSFAAVCMIVACLLIMGSFSLLAVNLNHTLGDLEKENEFLAYIDDSCSEEEARALQSQIEAVPNVSQVTFVSREEALNEFLQGREHNDLLDSMPATVLRDRYRIHVDNIEQMEQTTKLVEQVPGVAKVNAAIAIAQGFVLVRNIATGVALVLIGILAVFTVWYIVCRAGILSSYVLPSPGRVFQSFCKMLQSGELFRDLRISFLRVGKGFVIAFILAFAFGMLRAMIPASAGYYEYLVQFFKNVPPLSMIPLLILWCGIGETTKTVIIVLASFFPMYLNIVKGFTGCDRKLLEVGTMFGYTERQKFFRIMLPYAMADILVGMRIGLGYSWRAIIGAEMVAASTGLGHMILFAQQMSRTDKVIVGIFTIGIAGYLTDRIFGLLISIFLKGAGENGWN